MRLGTPAVTSRGFREEEMTKIAELLHAAATDYDAKVDYIRNAVSEMCEKYPLYN
jgi:glycine hydroxymethyltransferase